MRPAGEVRLALRQAASDLVTPERAPTLRELAAGAGVGYSAALHTVRHMARDGELTVPRTRKVDYRNRPVAEYAPSTPEAVTAAAGFVDLGELLEIWNR